MRPAPGQGRTAGEGEGEVKVLCRDCKWCSLWDKWSWGGSAGEGAVNYTYNPTCRYKEYGSEQPHDFIGYKHRFVTYNGTISDNKNGDCPNFKPRLFKRIKYREA